MTPSRVSESALVVEIFIIFIEYIFSKHTVHNPILFFYQNALAEMNTFSVDVYAIFSLAF